MSSGLSARIKQLTNRLFMSNSYDPDFRRELDRIERMEARYRERIGRGGSEGCLWRSVAQYRCQSQARGTLTVLAANFLAALALPFLALRFLGARKTNPSARQKATYLKVNFHMAYVIPNLIREDTVEAREERRYLRRKDLAFAFGLFVRAGAFYPELLAKFLVWIASARPKLDAFEIGTLIQYCEFSPYSSLRRAFLNHHSVQIANITHGEEVISSRNCFCTFDEYFAWTITPASVHKAVKIEYDRLFHFNPCENLPPVETHGETTIIGVLWPSVAGSDLDELARQINGLAATHKVVVRPHPNPHYANRFTEYRPRLKAELSDANQEGTHAFIDRCSVVVGYLSALLLQVTFRKGAVLYIENEYLKSIRTYHPHYQQAPSIPLEGLMAHFQAGTERAPTSP